MKWRIIVWVSLIVVAGTVVFLRRGQTPPPVAIPIAATGGIPMSIKPAHDVYYLQTDARWKDRRLGGSGEKIAGVGCTLCSVAMALESMGIASTPEDLNREMAARSGYTDQGLMIWGKISDITSGRAEVVVCPAPSHAEMDECLRRGAYPIIKIQLPRGVSHWVVVVGKEGLEYLIKDPLQADRQVVKLSTRTRLIESLRYVRKRPA